MPRKKGQRSPNTDKRAAEVAKRVLEEGKTVNATAKELGMHRNTASSLLHKAMEQDEVKFRLQRSKDRLIKMLSLADAAYLRVLKHNEPDNFGNQLKAATSIYKTMGLIKDEPTVMIHNVVPIKVTVENREYTIALDPTESSEDH